MSTPQWGPERGGKLLAVDGADKGGKYMPQTHHSVHKVGDFGGVGEPVPVFEPLTRYYITANACPKNWPYKPRSFFSLPTEAVEREWRSLFF